MTEYLPMQGREALAQYVGPVTIWMTDTMPSLDFVFSYDAGGYVDLSPSGVDATITVNISRYGGVKNVQSGNASIVSALRGEARYIFGSALPNPGLYEGQCKLDFGSGQVQRSQKFLLYVHIGTPQP